MGIINLVLTNPVSNNRQRGFIFYVSNINVNTYIQMQTKVAYFGVDNANLLIYNIIT